MKKLEALLRGSDEWETLSSDAPDAALERLTELMKSHGFKVVTDEQGRKRVINPITKECEVIYRIGEATK